MCVCARLPISLCVCWYISECCFPRACVSFCLKQAYLGTAVALTASLWEPATKAFTIASVMQDYKQDKHKSIGQQLLYSPALERVGPNLLMLKLTNMRIC